MISNISSKLEKESEGMLLHAIDGLRRLLTNGSFTFYQERNEAVEQMIEESDSVREWFKDSIEYTGNTNDKVFTTNLHHSYVEYMGGIYNTRISPSGLSRKVKKIFSEMGHQVNPELMTCGGLRARGFYKIKLIS